MNWGKGAEFCTRFRGLLPCFVVPFLAQETAIERDDIKDPFSEVLNSTEIEEESRRKE